MVHRALWDADDHVYTVSAHRMAETMTVRVSRQTHRRLVDLASSRRETMDETVRRARRALRQGAMARGLAADLRPEEKDWLDAHPA